MTNVNPVFNQRGDELLLGGAVDPTAIAVNAPQGSVFISESVPGIFQKLDNGDSTNFSTMLTSSTGMLKNFSNHDPSTVDIDLGTHKLINVVDPTNPQDAATKAYVDAQSHMNLDFSNHTPSAVDIDLGTHKLINVVDPTAAQDAATKAYVDGEISTHTHDAADVVSGSFADARISQTSVTQHQAAIDHDALLNFVANEHIDHSTVSITGSDSLAGGGDITANRSLSLVNDAAAPGNSMYYGTDGGGTKGFFALPSGGDAWGDPVDANIVPDADGTRDLGAILTNFNNIYGKSLSLGAITNNGQMTVITSQGRFNVLPSGGSFAVPSGGSGLIMGVSLIGDNGYLASLENSASDAVDTGDLSVETGNITNAGASGDTGAINLRTGTNAGGGSRGSISFIDGSEGTVGHVWTSQDANGAGAWQALPSGGDAWGDPVDASIVPDTTATYNLGTTSSKFQNLFLAGNLDVESTLALQNTSGTDMAQLRGNSGSSPSGQTASNGLRINTVQSAQASPLIIYTNNSSSANNNDTGNIAIETGNKTAGTGDSGSIKLFTGTSAGGTRGDVDVEGFRLDASACTGPFKAPNLSADPSSPENGDIWYNTTSNELKARVNGVTEVFAFV